MSKNETFEQVLARRISRRDVLKGGLGLGVAALFGTSLPAIATTMASPQVNRQRPVFETLTFKPIDISDLEDTVRVPEGYTAKVFYPWGEPLWNDGPAFKQDASNTAGEQAMQAGMHHDGMHYFPISAGGENEHGLLVMNHEYIDPTLLHTDGGYKDNPATFSKAKVDKEIAAHGVSVLEIQKKDGDWQINKNSNYNRRITTATPMTVTGAAKGSRLMQTKADPNGALVLGTNNNCANGYTPWGTYLTCEENFHKIFGGNDDAATLDDELTALHKRYGIKDKSSFGWETQDERFSVAKEPHEPNRFGWIVEIDPFDPNSTPKKHTAMGRFSHENCAHFLNDDKLAFYSGDDARFEYIYKFVPAEAYNLDDQAANRDLLEDGTLYVAQFNDDGSGTWLPLIHGQNGLTAANGFADQGDVMIKTRLAADQVGATQMDRPEWIAVHPNTNQIYCTLTNNSKRTADQVNASSPRADNDHGHIIRWREEGDNPHALTFNWDIFLLGGNPQSEEQNLKGNLQGDIFSSPDGIYIDQRGAIWLQTDISGKYQNKDEYKDFGNNQMLVVDPITRQSRRFLTGSNGCEVTGITMTPDMKTMWVNIQHPGDIPGALKDKVKKTPETPKAASSWPDGDAGQRPRSATVMITKDDGGLIGT
jgi:secreted PhoX family phosphatase